MSYIWIRSPRKRVPTGPAVDVRCDLPFRAALRTALVAFEAAYLAALVEQQTSLAGAARASGIPVDDLVGMILRHGKVSQGADKEPCL